MKICVYCDRVFNICHCSKSKYNGEVCPIKNEMSCPNITLRPEIANQRAKQTSQTIGEPENWTLTNHTVYIYDSNSKCSHLFHSLETHHVTIKQKDRKRNINTVQMFVSFCPICHKYYVTENELEHYGIGNIMYNITVNGFDYTPFMSEEAPKRKKKRNKKVKLYYEKKVN